MILHEKEIDFDFTKKKEIKKNKKRMLLAGLSLAVIVNITAYTIEHTQTICALYENGSTQCFSKRLSSSYLWDWL